MAIFRNRLFDEFFQKMLLLEKNGNFRSELGSIWVFDSRVFKDDALLPRSLDPYLCPARSYFKPVQTESVKCESELISRFNYGSGYLNRHPEWIMKD